MIRVLIVDDSALVRRVLREMLDREADIEVVGHAPDPYVAREKIVSLNPDVVTLDIEMPRMDGLTFLAALMEHRPIPVVVISSLTERGSEIAMRALELGAVEVLSKPGSQYSVEELGPRLGHSIRAAAKARLRQRSARPEARVGKPPISSLVGRTTDKVLAIGGSTGGTEAIADIMRHLPGDTPGTVIVQHMPPLFTTSFAKRLDSISAMRVHEARGGEDLMPGMAFVAPGGSHVVVVRSGAKFRLRLDNRPQVHFQRPAVDVTFASVAEAVGGAAVGILLTGMGVDGADGLVAMRRSGAVTIAQDEASSVVFGMPRAAIERGGACEVLALDRIAARITQLFARLA
jgi:two-component system chemotaxis response regulator CheB